LEQRREILRRRWAFSNTYANCNCHFDSDSHAHTFGHTYSDSHSNTYSYTY